MSRILACILPSFLTKKSTMRHKGVLYSGSVVPFIWESFHKNPSKMEGAIIQKSVLNKPKIFVSY